jgi:hypothetical protein
MKQRAFEKIADILRVDKDTIFSVERIMSGICGHNKVLEKIVAENSKVIQERLELLGLKTNQSRDIYNSLLDKIKDDDRRLSKALDHPVCVTRSGCRSLFDVARKIAGVGKGFFLKKEKAEEFLLKVPPNNVLKILGYNSVKQLLENEDLFEIYAALRFVEKGGWLNKIFFKQYQNLTPDDFEEREIETLVLSERWCDVAEEFLRKKYHNISHLKELGVIFVLPAVLNISGETLRTLGSVLHYFHEIDFYSRLFRRYSRESNFSGKLISSLRGDVLDSRFSEKDLGKKWMIVQRYLAKDDANDWRLFEPHVNPEAIHWRKAEDNISELGKTLNTGIDLSFWKDLDYVGDYFPTATGVKVLVSFNLVDTVMSLVKKREMVKYLYHHQEALWNKIFYEFVGEDKMEELIVANFNKGFVELTNRV